MPIHQVASDACGQFLDLATMIYTWPYFGYCIDSAGAYYECYNKCGMSSPIAITCATDCASPAFAAGQGICIQENGFTSCQTNIMSGKSEPGCTVGTSCTLVDHNKQKCDGTEFVFDYSFLGPDVYIASGTPPSENHVLKENTVQTGCIGGKGDLKESDLSCQFYDKSKGSNLPFLGNSLADFSKAVLVTLAPLNTFGATDFNKKKG